MPRRSAGGGDTAAQKFGDMLLADDFSGPVPAHMRSLNLLVCTEARERSPAEYRALPESAGFRQVEARRTGAPLDAALALKPEKREQTYRIGSSFPMSHMASRSRRLYARKAIRVFVAPMPGIF